MGQNKSTCSTCPSRFLWQQEGQNKGSWNGHGQGGLLWSLWGWEDRKFIFFVFMTCVCVFVYLWGKGIPTLKTKHALHTHTHTHTHTHNTHTHTHTQTPFHSSSLRSERSRLLSIQLYSGMCSDQSVSIATLISWKWLSFRLCKTETHKHVCVCLCCPQLLY